MRALLLAAGLGTRLKPITNTVPKCLVPVKGKPLLGYWLDLLLPSGVDEILLNTHYLSEKVRQFVSDTQWRDRVTLVHEDTLFGTGGTILKNRNFLSKGPFIVAHADNLTRFNVKAFIDRHVLRPPSTFITMMTFSTDDPGSCGIVEENGSGIVTAFHEKVENPPGNHANAAVYIMEPEVIDYLAGLGSEVIDLSTEVIPHFMGRICTFHNSGYHRDIGNPESLRLAELEFKP